MRASLAAAYRRTDYEVAGAVARIGRRNAAVDALLRRLGTRQGAFTTAWNPFSRKMPRGWNERMQARLREATRRLPMAEGWGRGRGWAEHSLLIATDPRRAAVLARRFRQNAIVLLRIGAPARLLTVVRMSPPQAGLGHLPGWQVRMTDDLRRSPFARSRQVHGGTVGAWAFPPMGCRGA
ncbi:MAG: DUF3293 domain-containing protein [Acetobacteraceae bacterium]|nr:DUF3293 domain-containing protein [Acetobacteraceae bacterium]